MRPRLSICVFAIFVISLVLTGCAKKQQEEGRDNDIVATVGSRTITLGQLETRFQRMPLRQRPRAEGLEALRELLETMINKELIAQAAEEEIGELSERQKIRLARRTRNIVYEVLEEREIQPNLEVTDAEIEEFHERKRIGYRPRHILVKTLGEANEVLSLLSEGAYFEALALEMSLDSKSYMEGGDLGYIGLGDMPEEFEEALEKMKVGETIGPVKTERGYHIIRLEDKREVDRPPLDDRLREQLEFQIMARRAKAAKAKFLANAKQRVEVKYYPEAVRLLDRRFTALWADQKFLDDPASIGQPGIDPSPWFPPFSEEDRSLKLATIGDSTITLGTWIEDKIYAPAIVWPKGGGDEWIREYLDDTYYKDIIIAYGIAEGMLDDPAVREKEALAREEILVNTFYMTRIDTVGPPSEEEAWQFYEENLRMYSLPDDLVQATLLHFVDKDAAIETLERWKGGAQEAELYKEMKESGALTEWEPSNSIMRSEAEAEIFEACWARERGEFFGPIEIFGEFIVGRMEGKTPAGPIPWEYAKDRVLSDLVTRRKEDMLMGILDGLRGRYPVQVFDDVLARAEIPVAAEETEAGGL